MVDSTGGVPARYRFSDDYNWSTSSDQVEYHHRQLQRALSPWGGGHVSVVTATAEQDKSGTDYVVTSSSGESLNVDVKARRPGASSRWRRRDDPELAIEVWSSVPDAARGLTGSAGWAFDSTKTADAIAYIFAPYDWPETLVYEAAAFRETVAQHWPELTRRFKPVTQRTATGRASQVFFVPESVFRPLYEAVKARNDLRQV